MTVRIIGTITTGTEQGPKIVTLIDKLYSGSHGEAIEKEIPTLPTTISTLFPIKPSPETEEDISFNEAHSQMHKRYGADTPINWRVATS